MFIYPIKQIIIERYASILLMIFCFLYSHSFHSQSVQNGWYILDKNCAEPSCIELKNWSTDEVAKTNTILLLDLKNIQVAIPAFDENHQPMLAIQVDENYFTIFEHFIHKNNPFHHPIAIVIDNQIIIRGTPEFNITKTKILFKGKYTFEETKTISNKINENRIPRSISKQQDTDETYISEALNHLLFQPFPINDNPSETNILTEDFLFRIHSFQLLNKTEFTHLEKLPITTSEFIEKSSIKHDTNYFYWSKDKKTCEVKSYFFDKKKNVYILHSIWLKEKKKWKLWRIYLNN